MMNNNVKKYQCLVALLLSAMMLSGCGSTTDNIASPQDTSSAQNGTPAVSGETESETIPEPEAPSDGLENVNMDGFSMTFLSYDGTQYWWSRNQIDATEITGEPVNDAIFERNAALEVRFNAQIQENKVASVQDSLQRDVFAGATDYQVAMVNDQQINSCLVAGSLLMWNDMSKCRLDNPWWNADANNVFQVNGKQYAAVGDFNLSEYSKSYMIYFNKDIYATRNSVSDLYQLALDGKWTYDTFLSLVEQYSIDLDGNGSFDNADQYGIAGEHRVIYQQLLTGAGIKYININEEGNPYFAIQGNENAVTIMQKISEDFGKTYTYLNTNDTHVIDTMFHAGQIVFLANTMYDNEYFRSYDLNIGMLPSPKWDETQENYYSITVGGVVSALPKTLSAEEQENAGILMEAMAFASRQTILPIYKESVLQGKYANDQESAEMVDIIFNSQTYDLGVTVWDVRGQFMARIFEKNNTNVVSQTKILGSIIEKQIQETIDEVTTTQE